MKSACLILFLFWCILPSGFTQTLDNKFADPLVLRPAKIMCIRTLPDGKLLMAGDIKYFKNTSVNNLIRLTNDSTLDESFSFAGPKNILIQNIEIQSNGNIIVRAVEYISALDAYNGHYLLYQLNSNGIILKKNDSFDDISSIALQGDDKVLVCGNYSAPGGYIKRLNSDLSADQTFNNNIQFDDKVTAIAVHGSDIFAAGMFSKVNGLNKKSIIKLNPDGSLDNNFNSGTGTNDQIGSLTIQDDGKILPGNTFINSYNGTTCHGLVRINADGSLDTGFSPPRNLFPLSKIVLSGTNMLIGASVDLHLNSQFGTYFLRLTSNGSLDQEFTPIKLDDLGVDQFCMAFNGDKLIFNCRSSQGSTYGLSECDFAGKLISTFSPQVERFGVVRVGDYLNQKLLIGGDFVKVNGTLTYGMAMLDKNGVVDQTFLQKENLGSVIQLKILDNSNLIVSTGANFFKLDKKAQNIPDFNFQHFKTLYNVTKFKILNDGKIFASDCNNVYRLNPDGSEDQNFNIGTGISNVCTAYDFDIQDSKVIFGSDFNGFNGINVNRIIRLNEDGSLDNTFNTGTGPDGEVTLVKVLKSGEIIVAGEFSHFNGIDIPNKVVKLTKNGAVDPVFLSNQTTVPFPGLINSFYPKAELIDTMVYIKNLSNISVFNVNGKIYDFKLPVDVNRINDFITIRDTTITGGKKSLKVIPCMYALGSFGSTSENPESIIKVYLGDGSDKATGVKDNPFPDVLIFPVPVHDNLHIQFPGAAPASEISMVSSDGRSVYSSKTNTASIEIDMTHYSPGIYFLRIVQNGTVIIKRIIKK
jgi:uncharacterized delta-60 repeat protein